MSAVAAVGQQAQPRPGPNFVSAAEMTQAIADARPWPSDPTVKYKRFGARDGYSYWVVQRDATGKVEQHDDWTDIFVVQSGEATLVTGGQITGGEATSPGELLGGEIQGGHRQRLGPNDVSIVPAGTPHQFVVASGRPILYVTIKTARGGTR
jgi:mannose-6-phosphate isomerase-like protein (cupin superfamily)